MLKILFIFKLLLYQLTLNEKFSKILIKLWSRDMSRGEKNVFFLVESKKKRLTDPNKLYIFIFLIK